MIRIFKILLSFYSSLQPLLADGVCFNHYHHHHEYNHHEYHYNEHIYVNAGGFCYNMPELMQNIAEHGIRGVVGAGMNDLAGEDHPWKNIVRNCAANVVGQWGAGQIGDMYLDPQSIFHNPVVHKLAHGLVGALSGSLMGGTGCVMSGAVGAMVGETLGCLMLEEPLSRQEQAVGGRMLTQAEYEAVSQKAYHDYQTHMMDVAKFAKIMTVMSAALTGLNVNVANQAAANAIDYNLLHVAAFGLLTVTLGYSAYCVYQAYKTDGVVGALKQLGIEIALNVAGVATGKFLVKVGGKLIQCECVKQALEVVYKNTPGLQTALSAIMPGIIAAIEAFDRTALGQLVGRMEDNLVRSERFIMSLFERGEIHAAETEAQHVFRRYWNDGKEFTLNGRTNKVYQRDDLIDLNRVDNIGKSNLQRMIEGKAPLGQDDLPINLHHSLQTMESPLIEMTQTMHSKNHRVLHIWPNKNYREHGSFNGGIRRENLPEINRQEFDKWRGEYWKVRVEQMMGNNK